MTDSKDGFIEPAHTKDLDRRAFLFRLTTLICTSAGVNLLLGAIPFPAFALQKQYGWRYCQNCYALFWDGRNNKGRCPAGSVHVATGYDYYMLIGDVGEAVPPGQTYWRSCQKCNAMFYGGYKSQGNCPAGGSHVRQHELYTLEHDRAAAGGEQPYWRFCNKCYVLFYDGSPNKGRCPTGNGHIAQGFNFVLKFGHPMD